MRNPFERATVVKVGGSLYDLADLGSRLRRWLASLSARDVLLVPGGGPTADVVRAFDQTHRLGEETAHWLALRALSLNAHFLAHLLPGGVVCPAPAECLAAWEAGAVPVLDLIAFSLVDERSDPSNCLAHSWAVTSDALAARVAVCTSASRLILFKSVDIPADLSWEEAGRRGLVDPAFAGVIRQAPRLEVQAVNLRDWQ